jgi:HIRAN domain
MSMFSKMLRIVADKLDNFGVDNPPGTAELPQSFLLRGDGTYQYEVVGESHYQGELEAICGGRTEEGVELKQVAVLINDDGNRYDPNAVAVYIGKHRVGHLPRHEAPEFRKRMALINPTGVSVGCRAIVRGGWDRGGKDVGSFGVWLDVCLPIEIEARLR